MSEMYRVENYTHELRKYVVSYWNNKFYIIYQGITFNIKNYDNPVTVSYSSHISNVNCLNIYECFDTIYEQNFSHALACGKPSHVDGNVFISPAYVYSHTSSYPSERSILMEAWVENNKYSYTTFKNMYRNNIYNRSESYYECNVEYFIPFERDEVTNQLHFNSSLEVNEYIVQLYHNMGIVYQWIGYFLKYLYISNYKLSKDDNSGSMYIHMTCSR